MKRLGIIFLSLVLFLPGKAVNRYFVEQISLSEGLSQTSVQTVLRDAKGLVWIGTKDGLNRYDGSEMNTYFHEPDDSTSIPDNQILFVAEDSNQNIWVGTSGGMGRYAPSQDAFERINPFNTDTLPVYTHHIHLGDSVIFGSSDHISIYDLSDESFRVIPFRGEAGFVPLSYTILPWKDEKVLLASRWQGLFILDVSSGEIRHTSFCQEYGVMDAAWDSQNNLWVSVATKGLIKYRADGSVLGRYTEDNSGLSNNTVLDIQLVDGQMWLGSDGGGIDIYDAQKDSIYKSRNIPRQRTSSQLNTVTTIYEDHYSNVWIGTMRGGLLGMRESRISSFQASPLNTDYGLSYPTVLNMTEDEEGTIWIGTDGEGVNAFDPGENRFRHYPSTFGRKVNGLAPLDDSRLLLNFFGEGLSLFHTKTGRVKSFNPRHAEDLVLPGSGTIGIDMEKVGRDEVVVLGEGIYFYDIADNRFEHFETSVLRQGEGGLIAGGRYNEDLFIFGIRSVYRLDLNDRELSKVCGIEMFPGDVIQSAFVDSARSAWVGTSRGLYEYTSENGVQKRIESRLVRKVKSVMADEKGRIWLGAGGNLYSYYKTHDFFKVHGRSDGVVPNEYLSKATLRTGNGDVYLGGVKGFARIGHDYVLSDQSKAYPHIISIREDGAYIGKERYDVFRQTGNVVLPYDFQSFRVRLFVDDADFFNKNYIRYTVEGFADRLVETSEMDIDLSGLPNGEYTLKVSAKSSDGRWTEPEEMMHIKVLPPWWQTWWFFAIAGATLFLLLLLVRYLVYRRAMDRMQVEMVRKENALNEQRIRFLVNISHELRTPLSLVYGPLERVLKGRVESEDEKNRLLHTMFRHLNYIRELIDQLLDFRKMDQKIEQVNLAQIDLNQWLQDTIHEFDVLFRDREVHVQFDLDEQLPNVWFDREKLKRVVYNLLNNAFKYAPETRIIYVQTRSEDQERVVVSVADQGPGIPEDKKKKIFDRFYMLEKQQGATGIGLAYAKMLIELHGGNMGVENRDPSGAVFYFELPLGPTSETEGEEFSLKTPGKFASEEESISGDDQKQATSVDESFFHDLTMLVVEDDPELLSFLKESIVSVFKRVLTAQNGEEALAEVRNSYPDIVVSDVMMPVKDGWDLCRDIKSDLEISHIPVVLMTAKSDEQDLVKGYKLGADQYLTKPVSFDLLFSVVENLLKNRMMLKQRYQESSIQLKPADLTFSNADEAFLAKLNTIIEREIENPELSVDLLVDKMAMSRAALYNKLKAIVGTSINNYINKYRVNYAEALLKETDLSIADIAIKLGFSGQGYFSTLFRQFTDYSPRQFRKKFRPDASEGK